MASDPIEAPGSVRPARRAARRRDTGAMRRLLLVAAATLLAGCGGGDKADEPLPEAGGKLRLESPAFHQGGDIPTKFSCDGADVSPALAWRGVPSGARELALVMEDPDAGGFVHWTVLGIRPGTSRVREGQIQCRDDIVAAHAEGTVARLRPKIMTITTMAAGLVPLLWAQGAGAEIMRRVAAPMIGGLITSAFLTLEVLPVLYNIWRTRQLRHSQRTGIPLETIVGRAPAWTRQ